MISRLTWLLYLSICLNGFVNLSFNGIMFELAAETTFG
jgi:hypothetical protein